jgi:uncharacterized protein YidB (DUF937 family)
MEEKMDIMQLASQLIQEKFGDNLNIDTIQDAFANLVGGEGGQLDLGNLVSSMMGDGGLGSIVNSWLGDGENAGISVDQLGNLFADNKISEFASSLNIDSAAASAGLTDILPQLIDKSSSGGSLLDAAGGLDGLVGMAKKLF